MAISPYALWSLSQEARALLTRLARVRSFALVEPMLPAANLLPATQDAIERHLVLGRHQLRQAVRHFLEWLGGPAARQSTAEQAQRRFTFLKLRFNAVITQFDLFNDVISQRSENEIGVWLSGLDVVSADALFLPGGYYEVPPVICYLDRGVGAAIRRARTRLPGGGSNPVGIIRIPRERMIGSGIASSLIHEVGHQGAALLDLVNSLRPVLQGLQRTRPDEREVWQLWERWISEIVADFWSVARLGISSTMGLRGVVSLPRPFVFRLNVDDPHPVPWIRVKLSCAMGDALYPHPQWQRLADLWQSYYPIDGLQPERRQLLMRLEQNMPAFVAVLVNHRPQALRGRTLVDALGVSARQPAQLAELFRAWNESPAQMYRAAPSLVFAVLGQASADGQLTPEDESALLAKLLTHWALRSTLDASAECAAIPIPAATTQTAWLRREERLTIH
ncbi:MAG TPA: hypothetical protein VFE73_19305 [Reyranella sp.]|jgi:hypothetical protein|nr:hypothetical protein [Reyranella sp.]